MRHRHLAALLCTLPMALPVAAQIPDTFTNLKVFPTDVARGELIGSMRNFSMSLGVRCVHCHVGPADGSLQGADFASDEKETKETARKMLRMVQAINGDHLSQVGTDIEVACFTCHRGASRPSRLEDELFAAWRAGGPDSLLAGYRGLRKAYYGRAIFDFGDQTLMNAAALMGTPANGVSGTLGAVAALSLETELFPEYAPGWTQLAGALVRSGDTTAALTAIRKADELAPGNPQIQRLLQQIQGNRP